MFSDKSSVQEKVPVFLSVTISSLSRRSSLPLLAVAERMTVTLVAGDLSALEALP